MLAHVERGELGLTAAHLLLEAAGGQGGPVALNNLRKDLNREITAVQVKINAKAADLASKDKEIAKADATVKNYFPPYLTRAWIAALKRGSRLPRHAKFKYGAGIVKDKAGKRLVIPAITVGLVESELERLAEVVMVIDRLVKDARPEVNALARQRAALQNYASVEDGPVDYLSAGLDAVADLLQPPTWSTEPVDWRDREQTLEEVNRGDDRDREEQARQVVPATDGLEIADTQPAEPVGTASSRQTESDRPFAELDELNSADAD